MFKTKPISGAIKLALGAGAGSLSMGMAPLALAQDGADDVLEEIVTTGSRIPVDKNLLATSPVTTVGSQELTFSGVTRVEDLVNKLPQVVPELTGNESNGSTGTATLDLRGLGSERTLVLVNGHRMGFGDPYVLAPDINQIPGVLVERVELLTGGASSTYGSDAVAGVVNFIMKDNFEGFQFDYQISGYQHDNSNGTIQQAIDDAGYQQAPGNVNDGEMTQINVIFGANVADGRGNVTGYLGYRDIEAIRHSERDYSACALGSANTCLGSSTIPEGSFRDFADIDLYLNQQTGNFDDRAGLSYNYGPINYFQRPDERWTAGLFAEYEVSPGVEAYGEFMFMEDRSLAQIAPSGTFFNNTDLNCDNPLLSAQQFAAIGCTSPQDRVGIYVGKRNVEGGPRFDDMQHASNRALVGFRGDIGDNWSWDVFGNFARTKLTETYNNDLSISRIVKALDIVADTDGTPVCRSFLDGSDPLCVPYNVFQPNAVTPEAVNYLNLPLYSVANMQQYQGVGYVTGELPNVKLPSADSGLSLVFGLEYRDENMVFDLDQNYNDGNAAGQGGATADVAGSIIVKEAFTEARVPLVQGRTGIEDLSLDLRYRYSDYNLGFDANTWNVGLAYSPTDWLKFRGSQSRSVRAPNINELFQPQTIGLWSGQDPCAGANPTLTEAQCALTGVPAGSYGSVAESPADQYNGLFGGNPNLNPEESDALTVGFLLNTEFGLTLSMDYWQIEVTDAIDNVSAEFIINQCGLTGDATFCDAIQRNQVNGNVWVGSGPDAPRVEATNTNIGFFEVSGVDINGNYTVEFGNHGLDFMLRGTALTAWDDQPQPGGVVNDCKGFWGGACGRPRPEWKHTFTTRWLTPVQGLDAQLTWRYVGEVKEFATDRFTASAQNYFDLAGGWNFNLFEGDAMVTVGINNILDEDPPAHGALNTVSVYSNGNTIGGTWDPLGRYWFLGFSYAQ